MIRHSPLGSIVVCEHRYKSKVTGQLRDIGACEHRFVSHSERSIVEIQAVAAGWEKKRFPGGIQHFCPDHTERAIAERRRAELFRNTERLWK